jgi:hypothetical protein
LSSCGSLVFSKVEVPFSLEKRRVFVPGRGRGFVPEHLLDFCEVVGQNSQGSLHSFNLSVQAPLDGKQRMRVRFSVEGDFGANPGVFGANPLMVLASLLGLPCSQRPLSNLLLSCPCVGCLPLLEPLLKH